jgi:hypothetical protein
MSLYELIEKWTNKTVRAALLGEGAKATEIDKICKRLCLEPGAKATDGDSFFALVSWLDGKK